MPTFSTEAEIQADRSIRLSSPLPPWLKPGRAHVHVIVDELDASGPTREADPPAQKAKPEFHSNASSMELLQSRWPVFGIISLLAIPTAYPMMFLTSWFADAIGIDTMHTNSPYAGIGSTAGGLGALLLGAAISLTFGLRFGILGVRREEKWWGLALLGAVLNGILLTLFLCASACLVFEMLSN